MSLTPKYISSIKHGRLAWYMYTVCGVSIFGVRSKLLHFLKWLALGLVTWVATIPNLFCSASSPPGTGDPKNRFSRVPVKKADSHTCFGGQWKVLVAMSKKSWSFCTSSYWTTNDGGPQPVAAWNVGTACALAGVGECWGAHVGHTPPYHSH